MRTMLILVLGGATIFSSGCAARYTHFGQPMTLADSDTMPIETLMASADSYNNKQVRVSGTVAEVCQHKGCWINMKPESGGDALFVKFTCPVEPDARLIPLEAVGRPVIVEGKLTVEEISEDEAKHYAQDAGMTEEDIAKITGPQKRLRIASPAAMIDMPKAEKAAAMD